MVNTNKPYIDHFKSNLDSKPKNNTSDTEIWDSFRSGSESAFITIYQNFFDKLYAYGWKISNSEDLVKDAIQDLFIELRKNRAKLGQTNSIKFYLFKSLKRKLIKEEGKWYSNLESIDANYFFDFNFSPEQLLIDRQMDEERTKKLNHAIRHLSPRKKEVIYYYFYEELSYKEIQEIMNLDNIKSVRNLIYKSISFLRETF
ncbi:sigma-70 family RNA polymerase sigma factor [Belliella sp. DSM 107340]|uniref:Sigma-70 family RNA polymerase sigma factor n=1 Tax=Belliella calami TaxID=2923436 RepID=A0ABS9UNA5_9BACT|nr:sigma-70 family RNA polymerase sigma factor [Belliella calami]MCH7398091.1 sigma-70 family RNA polymerase sigma factor [Belliella calami]